MQDYLDYYLYLFAASFVLSMTLTTVGIYISTRIGFYDLPGERKIHSAPTPYGGGVAIFITIYLILLTGWGVMHFSDPQLLPAKLQIHMRGILSSSLNLQMAGILLGGLVIFIVGLIDDIKGLGPKVKLLAGFIAAAIVISSGTMASGFMPWVFAKWILTALWIVGITNAFNLLDNMDGLCAGVAIIASTILMVLCLQSGELFVTAFIILFMGALSGFWIYNFRPAKIFLGDSGSLLIGYFLSIVTILPTFYDSHQENAHVLSVFIPILILAIPIFDTMSVMMIRIKNKKPLFQGDKNHFSHRLVSLGLSQQQAVLLIYLVCLSTGISTLLLLKMDIFGSCVMFVQVVFIFLIIAILENAGRKKRN